MKRLSILILLASFQLAAHESVESHKCNAPSGTGRITSDMEREVFQAELAIYESCMFAYIREQQKQAEVHEQAAMKALDIWNEYLRSNIK